MQLGRARRPHRRRSGSGTPTRGAPMALVLAHQGGWDEAVFLGAPVLVFAGLLWLAARRASQLPSEQQHDLDDKGDTSH